MVTMVTCTAVSVLGHIDWIVEVGLIIIVTMVIY